MEDLKIAFAVFNLTSDFKQKTSYPIYHLEYIGLAFINNKSSHFFPINGDYI